MTAAAGTFLAQVEVRDLNSGQVVAKEITFRLVKPR